MIKQHAEFHKLLGDETRLRLLAQIQPEGELCVCELVYALDVPQPRISRHLATLKHQGVLLDRRDKFWVYYSVNPNIASWQSQLIDIAVEALEGEEQIDQDKQRLANMNDRPNAGCCA